MSISASRGPFSRQVDEPANSVADETRSPVTASTPILAMVLRILTYPLSVIMALSIYIWSEITDDSARGKMAIAVLLFRESFVSLFCGKSKETVIHGAPPPPGDTLDDDAPDASAGAGKTAGKSSTGGKRSKRQTEKGDPTGGKRPKQLAQDQEDPQKSEAAPEEGPSESERCATWRKIWADAKALNEETCGWLKESVADGKKFGVGTASAEDLIRKSEGLRAETSGMSLEEMQKRCEEVPQNTAQLFAQKKEMDTKVGEQRRKKREGLTKDKPTREPGERIAELGEAGNAALEKMTLKRERDENAEARNKLTSVMHDASMRSGISILRAQQLVNESATLQDASEATRKKLRENTKQCISEWEQLLSKVHEAKCKQTNEERAAQEVADNKANVIAKNNTLREKLRALTPNDPLLAIQLNAGSTAREIEDNTGNIERKVCYLEAERRHDNAKKENDRARSELKAYYTAMGGEFSGIDTSRAKQLVDASRLRSTPAIEENTAQCNAEKDRLLRETEAKTENARKQNATVRNNLQTLINRANRFGINLDTAKGLLNDELPEGATLRDISANNKKIGDEFNRLREAKDEAALTALKDGNIAARKSLEAVVREQQGADKRPNFLTAAMHILKSPSPDQVASIGSKNALVNALETQTERIQKIISVLTEPIKWDEDRLEQLRSELDMDAPEEPGDTESSG
jgi:hypothetical protein